MLCTTFLLERGIYDINVYTHFSQVKRLRVLRKSVAKCILIIMLILDVQLSLR